MPEFQPTIPNPESDSIRLLAVQTIKEKGLQDQESIVAYSAWCAAEESKVSDARGQQELELRKAELLIEAGQVEYAYDEILEPMRQSGAEFFEQNTDLKAKLDSFYQ